MSNESANLIDLSNEEKLEDEENASPANTQNPFKQVISLISDMDIGEQFEDRTISCNNPFDSVQQIANRADDPFESVYREVTNNTQSSESDIKTDNLLSLSDGNITIDNEDKIHSAPILDSVDNSYQESVRKFRKSLAEIATSCTTLINLESPPVLYSLKSSSETIDSVTSGDSDGSTTKVINRKKVDGHNRLLKLSLSNSTSNTSVSRVSRRLTGLTSDSSIFKESEADEGRQKTSPGFAHYSKSLNDSSEDLASTKPNWLDSETDIDKDLEMLTIPMLNEIDSSLPLTIDDPRTEKYHKSETNLDLESFRERVQKHRKGANNLEISNLIQSLKSVIEENPNEEKKQEAISLLENLSTVLCETNDASKGIDSKENSATPQPIVRQGTFDMDLKGNEEYCDQKMIEEQKEDTIVSETSCVTHSTHSVHSERSIATDECEVITSTESPNIKHEEEYHETPNYQQQQMKTPEQCNIVNHISKLFGGELYDINVQAINEVVSSGATGNPTYIVVVNTPKPPPLLHGSVNNLACTQNSNDGSLDLEKCNEFRRRSQSLSVRDTSHLQKPATLGVPKLTINEQSGFKTPSRMVLRRNSFCNAMTNNSLSSINVTNANKTSSSFAAFPNKNTSIRHSITLTPRHRKNASIDINPSSFKTGFNAKKLKFKSSTESIFTSTGPMKATLPLRKVTSKILATEKSPTAATKGGSIIATSTPIYLNNSYQASSNAQRKFYTTPTMDPSPVRRTEVKSVAPKTRYSFALTSMSEKLGVVNHLKRRTISELRDKPQKTSIGSSSTSDIKTTKDHSSLVGATLSGVSKQNTHTVKLPQNFSRSLSKLTPAGTIKLNTRSAVSTKTPGLSTVVHKNKENKRP